MSTATTPGIAAALLALDATNPRMRKRAAQDLGIGHTRQPDVARIQRLTGYLFRRVDARNALSNQLLPSQVLCGFILFAAC